MDHAAWLRIRGASSQDFKLGAQARTLFSQGRNLTWIMLHNHGSEAQARMLLNSGGNLACFSARGASLHGPCSMVTDQRRKPACVLNSGRELACFSARGASLVTD
jgi:hypothetical protein